MTLLQSLFLGRPGDYRIGGIPISIYRKKDVYDSLMGYLLRIKKLKESKDIISDAGPSSLQQESFLESFSHSIAALLSQRYFYIFIHAMGYAVTTKFLKKYEQPRITIYLKEHDANFFTCGDIIGGEVSWLERPNSDWKYSVLLASGPLSECIVSGVHCLAIATLSRYLPSIVTQSIYFLTLSSFVGRSINSVQCFQEKSDFSEIEKISYKHLAIATALVAGNLFIVIATSHKINSIKFF